MTLNEPENLINVEKCKNIKNNKKFKLKGY